MQGCQGEPGQNGGFWKFFCPLSQQSTSALRDPGGSVKSAQLITAPNTALADKPQWRQRCLLQNCRGKMPFQLRPCAEDRPPATLGEGSEAKRTAPCRPTFPAMVGGHFDLLPGLPFLPLAPGDPLATALHASFFDAALVDCARPETIPHPPLIQVAEDFT